MKVSVDSSRCTGHARCNALAPEVFTVDDLGYSDIGENKDVPPELEAKARLGASACPERALRIEE